VCVRVCVCVACVCACACVCVCGILKSESSSELIFENLYQNFFINPAGSLSHEIGPTSIFRCVVRVCCSVLQGVAACCSVLQSVAVCCNVLQCVAVCCNA